MTDQPVESSQNPAAEYRSEKGPASQPIAMRRKGATVEPGVATGGRIRTMRQMLLGTRAIANRINNNEIVPKVETLLFADQFGTVAFPNFTDDYTLKALAINIEISARGLLIIAMDTALNTKLGELKPRDAVTSERQKLQRLIFWLRNCYAHDPMTPRWQFNRHWSRAALYVDTIESLIEPSSLDGKQLDLTDIGGEVGFFKMVDAILTILDD